MSLDNVTTVRVFSQKYGIPQSTIYDMVSKGKLEYKRAGTTILIKDEAPEFINQGNCLACGKPLCSNVPHQKFCNTRCKMQYHYAKKQESGESALEERICPVCGNPFMVHPNLLKKFCGEPCRLINAGRPLHERA